jgi:hypothetical protein
LSSRAGVDHIFTQAKNRLGEKARFLKIFLRAGPRDDAPSLAEVDRKIAKRKMERWNALRGSGLWRDWGFRKLERIAAWMGSMRLTITASYWVEPVT